MKTLTSASGLNGAIMENLFDLGGKAALVTGGGRGLGRAMATALAQAGADVAVSDMIDTLETVNGIKAAGSKSISIRADVKEPDEVKAMVERAIQEFGRLDILVNNAGIFRMSPAEEMKTGDWDEVMNVNLRGQFLCAREVGRHMIKKKAGKVINISSVAGLAAFSDSAAYNASKAGLILLTKTLAAEWGSHNVQVNAICPGLFETAMTAEFLKDAAFMDYIRGRVPLARAGLPHELAGTVIYLASKASDYMTGHALVIDGGWLSCL